MFRRVFIGLSITFVLFVVASGCLLLSINPIINSRLFKEKLNAYLKGKGIHLNYEKASIKFFPLRITVKRLQLKKGESLSADIYTIKLRQPLTDKRVIVVKKGKVTAFVKGGKKKGKGKLKIPMIAKLHLESLHININHIPIRIEKVSIRENRKGSFKLSIRNTRLEGESYIKEGKIFISLNNPRFNIKELTDTAAEITGKKINVAVLKRVKEIEVSKLTAVIVPREDKIEIKAENRLKIALSEKTVSIPNISLEALAEKGTVSVKIRTASVPIQAVKDVLNAIEPKIGGKVAEIVNSGFVNSARFSMRFKGKIHIKDISVNAQIEKASINIPKTPLKASNVKANVTLLNGKLKAIIAQAVIDKTNLKDGALLIDFTTKPHPIKVSSRLSGDIKETLKTVLKAPVPESVKETLNRIEVKKGTFSGRLNLLIFKKTTLQFALKAKGVALMFAQLFNHPLSIPEMLVSYDKRLEIRAPTATTKGLKTRNISITAEKGLHINIQKGSALIEQVKEEPLCKKILQSLPYIDDLAGRLLFSDLKARLNGKTVRASIRLMPQNMSVKFKDFPLKGINAATVTGKVMVSFPDFVKGELIKLDTKDGLNVLIEKLFADLKKSTTRLSLWCRTSPALKRFLVLNNFTPLNVLPADGTEIKGELTLKPKEKNIIGAFLIKDESASLNVEKFLYSPHRLWTDLKVQGQNREICAKIRKLKDNINVSLKGDLNLKDLKDLIIVNNKTLNRGLVSSNLEAKIDASNIYNSTLNGKLVVKNAALNEDLKADIELEGRGKEGSATVDLSTEWGEVYALGNIKIEKDCFVNEFDLYGGTIDVDKILESLKKSGKSNKKEKRLPVKLSLNYYIETTKYKNLFVDDLTGTGQFDFTKDAFNIDIEETKLCGIRLQGNLKKEGKKLTLHFSSKGKSEFEKTLKCLTEGKAPRIITGKFDYTFKLQAEGSENPIKENSHGRFRIVSKKGRIYKATVLAKLLEFLTIQNLVTLRLPSFGKAGFAYKKLSIQGNIKNGVLYFKNCYINSSAMKIFFEGRWNILKDRLDLEVLIAPFTTIDAILSRIPLIGRILTGKSKTFVSIPLKVSGSSKNPKIMLHPLSVGSGLIGIMKRTLKAPVYILKPSENK